MYEDSTSLFGVLGEEKRLLQERVSTVIYMVICSGLLVFFQADAGGVAGSLAEKLVLQADSMPN